MKLILRPLTPPSALTFLKYAAIALPCKPRTASGPLCGMVLPMRISVALAPGSYFCADAKDAVARLARPIRLLVNAVRVFFIAFSPTSSGFVTCPGLPGFAIAGRLRSSPTPARARTTLEPGRSRARSPAHPSAGALWGRRFRQEQKLLVHPPLRQHARIANAPRPDHPSPQIALHA